MHCPLMPRASSRASWTARMETSSGSRRRPAQRSGFLLPLFEWTRSAQPSGVVLQPPVVEGRSGSHRGRRHWRVMPWAAASTAVLRVSPSRPCLLTPYAAPCSPPILPAIEEMLMDSSPSPVHHGWEDQFREDVGCGQVDHERQVPEVVVEIDQGLGVLAASHAGVVDQDLDGPPGFGDAPDDAGRGRSVRQVAADHQCVSTPGSYFPGQVLQLVPRCAQ